MSARGEEPPAGAASGASVGVLGGTFNPPHRGHLALARHALSERGLERVLLMPAGRSAHKSAVDDPGPEHRLRMCQLALEDDAGGALSGSTSGGPAGGLALCALEVRRAGPSYTIETLRALHAAHPGVRVTFVIGADAARTLPSWREPRELLELADLAVALRAGADRVESARHEVCEALAPLIAGLQGGGGRVHFLGMDAVEVSSSLVRERACRGESIAELVGPAVAAYIATHGLYHGSAAVGIKTLQR
jgi:nicotinate-nucleotide adenylyltransferase